MDSPNFIAPAQSAASRKLIIEHENEAEARSCRAPGTPEAQTPVRFAPIADIHRNDHDKIQSPI
jgi:hypothetical protein